jgi:glutamyl-tRNA synthetase
MADAAAFYLVEDVEYDPKAAEKFLTPELAGPLKRLIETLKGLERFEEAELEKAFRRMAEDLGVKLGKIAQPVRVALTGVTASPGLFEIIDILGKETVLRRLEKALRFAEARSR